MAARKRPIHETREQWLLALVEEIRPWYDEVGVTVPAVRISVGFSSKGLRSKVIGECWYAEATADATPQVFIHPALDDAEKVAATVVHELVHAAVGSGHKHGPVFKAPAVALGLEGKMTATHAGEALLARLKPVLKALGPYPHAALDARHTTSNGPKQGTRMLKCECSQCGYLVRTTQKWLDIATPTCPVDEIPLEVAA